MDIYKRLKRLYTEEEEKEQKKEEEKKEEEKKDNSDIIISKEYMNSYLPALEEGRTESYAGDKIDEFVEKPEPAYNPVETVTITSRPSQTVAEKTTPSLLDKETLTNQNTSRSFAEEKALDVTKGLNRNELTETYKIYTDKVASAIKQNNYYDFYENYIVAKEVEDMLKANNLFDVIGDGVEALAYGANTSFYTVMDGINKVINNYKYSDDNLNSSLLYKIASGTSNSVEETLNSGRNYLNNLHIQFPDDEKITMLYDYVTNRNFKGDQKEIADLVQYANLKERANANETYYNTYTKKAKDLQERSKLKTGLSYDGIAKQIVKGAEGVGNMGSTIVLNTIAGGGGLTMLALSAYSNAFEEAKKDGANESQANWYAILNSASEIASELIGGENVNAVLVKPLSTTPLGEAINSFIESQGIRSKFARSVIRNIGQVGAEFTEEMATATIDPILKYISYGYQQFPNAPEEYIKSIFDSGLDSISTTLLLSGIGKAETLAVLNKNQQNYEKAIRNSPYFNQEQKATMLKELQEATNQAKEVVTKDYEKTLKDLKSKLDNRKAQYQKNIGTVLENQTLTPEERANVVIKYNDKMVEQADVGSQTTQEIIDNNEKVRTSIADDIKAEIGRILDNNQKVQSIEPTEEISKSKSNIVNLINKISGLNMVLADIKSSDGSIINGFTNKKGSTVYVNSNMNLKDTLSTALHEVGHHYRTTYSDIFNKFVKKAGIETENDLTKEYREAHGMEDAPLEDVQEDMFGDYIGEILSKPKNVKSLEKNTRDIASIFQNILAGDMSNSKVSSYNLDFASKLGGDILNDTNFEKELLNSIKKQKTSTKPVTKKSEPTTTQQKGKIKTTTSQKKTDSREEKKSRETNKETPINNIVKRYNQMREAGENRPPAFEKMIADELGVEYNTKKSLNDPRISSIYEQLKQGIPADEIKFSKNMPKDEAINYSSEANQYNKLQFNKNEVPKDDNHIRQYEYIKNRLTDVVNDFNIAPEYDIKIRKDDPKRPDLFEVELYDKKGNLKGIIRVGNKGMWRKADSTLGKPVTTLKLSDYKTVFGLASSFKSAISKTFQEAINSLSDIKKAMKENDNSIAEKIGKKREIAEEKAKQREEKMNTDQEEYIKQAKEKETKKKIEDTEKQLKSDNEAFNKAVKNLGKKIEQLQTSKEKFENAYEDLKKDSTYKLAIEKFETQFANKAKNSEYSFNSNDKANFVMLRIFGTNIENAFNEVVRMKEETFKRINSINRTIDMLKDLRRVYKKMPNDLKVRIDSYISIYTKAVNMTELTLHNKFITSEYIKEHLLGKVPLTKGIRNKILTDGKEMVSLGDLLSTTGLAEAFERGVRELYEEAIEELARNRLQEAKEDMQEQIDNIGKAVKLVAEDTARKREKQTKAGEVKGRIAYTFKTETQALMQGDVDTSLMQIERNLQNGETRKKIAINRFYAILNREMKDSSGVNKLIHSKKFKEDLEKTLSRKAEWLDTGIEVDGRKLRLPKSMILSLAMHLKNDDNMAHISGAVVGAKVLDGEGFVMPDIVYKEGGGVVVPNETLYKKGDLSKAYSRGETVKLSKKQVEDIVSMLSEEEKEFLNTVADIYKLSTKLINEVSREVLGYDLATVENYFPIHAFLMENVHHIGTDDMTAEEMLNNYKNNFGGASIFEPGKAIRNQGQLKERTTSFAPIYLENIAEVLNRSINDTSLFYGYTQDLIKNDIILASSYEDGAKTGGTTRKTLKNMLNYIDNNYLKDYYKLVNFILGREKLNNKIRSLIAQNTLTFNIGTWLVQPMSFFNTLKYFSTKEFMKSINPLNNHVKLNDMVRKYYDDLGYDTSGKDNFELVRDFIAEATPILENRAINFRIPGVNQLFNKRMIDKLGIKGISTFDDIAVTAIARMMAYSVSLDPSIKFGSDEYFEVLGDRLNQVLLETQPERSDINRANIFRSDNPFARIFSLFGTPPNQILNNVASSSMNFRYKLEYGSEEEKQEAFNNLAKSVAGAIASSVGAAVIRATRDKVRAGDDDDVPYLDRIVGQYLVAMLSPTIIGDEIATWIMQQAKYGGISFYDISSPEVSYLTNLTTLANKLSKLPSEDVSATKKTVDIIKALGGVTGLDTRSLVHFTEAMLKFVFPDTYKAYTLLNNSNIYKKWAENKETDLSEFYVGYQVTRKKAIEAKGQKYNNESIKDALEEEGLGDLYEIFKLGKK